MSGEPPAPGPATPAATLRAAWERLEAGDNEGVLATLETWSGGAPLEAARVEAWRAQALWALGREEEGERAINRAIRAAKEGKDMVGVGQLRALREAAIARKVAQDAAARAREADRLLAERSDAEVLAGGPPEEGAERLVRKAGALIDLGRPEEAERCLSRAELEAGGTPRATVLVHLTRLRIRPDPEVLHAAWIVADTADDQNLVTAVAKAARAAGLPTPRPAAF